MNAQILKRVVRAIAERSQPDLDQLAQKLVESERRTGHRKLADELDAILRTTQPRVSNRSEVLSRHLQQLPTSRRHGDLLASNIPRELLQHDMVLPPQTEERFARIEAEYAARDRLGAFGLRPRKTILLYGPPGCGKSLGAKRLAWNTGLPLLKVRFDALLSSYFGESAANLRAVFEAAKERSCVLLLDECDFIARSRMTGKDIGEASRIVNSLLQFMEDYDAPGLLVATTNVEKSLDEALFRRFDDVFEVPLPGIAEIERLLWMTLSGINVEESIEWKRIASGLVGTSAATVVKVAQDAAKGAVLTGRKVITEANIRQAISDTKRTEPTC